MGYVMDNNISQAFAAVQTAINSRSRKLKVLSKGISTPSTALPEYEWSADTRHRCATGDLKVHHALLGVPGQGVLPGVLPLPSGGWIVAVAETRYRTMIGLMPCCSTARSSAGKSLC